ncbi:pali-domain-containing protein [Testicularia cyperi]|uniref:Pali-domain-containing protein n=1 Tax=Testicularia cyperi TaxID=1882483 RepID=A0A317XUF7_9BASI|nr:pali-domain-containing protein [Testicularia cyperi]
MIRPATPGTLLVLVAAILLGLVTISTPIIKSIYFLEATVGGSGSQSGQVATFGALGYCIGSQCSNTTLGYEFNPNELLGINVISGQYTTPIIKALTYTLILHPIALGFAAVAVLLGLISHCRELSTNCFGTFITSIGAFITLVAFGLDLALFVIAKKRIDSVNGASAQLGMAIWMTLAAWILMFLAGCAFSCGICSRRKRNRVKDSNLDQYGARPAAPMGDRYAEQMRMDALDAEADRKRRQNTWGKREGELPKFAEYETEHEVPLKNDYDDGAYHQHGVAYSTHNNTSAAAAGGAAAGSAINGVGQGYGRRQAAQQPQTAEKQFSNSPPMLNNTAGYGAHNNGAHRQNTMSSVTSPTTEATYVPGMGPQPYRDGLDSQQTGSSALGPAPRPYPMVTSPPPMHDLSHSSTAAQPQQQQQHDSYGNAVSTATGGSRFTQPGGARRQPTGDYGHSIEYSSATFGPGSGIHQLGGGDAPPMPMPSHQIGSSQIRGGRTLPGVPSEPQEIVYGNTAPAESHDRQGTIDDGFGLTMSQINSALPRGDTQDSSYEQYSSSAYERQQQSQLPRHAAGQSYYPGHPSEYHSGNDHEYGGGFGQASSSNVMNDYDDYQSSAGPPGYESVSGSQFNPYDSNRYQQQQQYGQHTSSGYPREKS